jgi:predicted DNA binding protein
MAVNTKQRDGALKVANRYRIAVARECERIAGLPWRDGREEVARLIEDCDDDALLSGRLAKYLNAPRYVGKAKAAGLMGQLEIRRADKRIRDLTGRQREVIAAAVRNGYKLNKGAWLNG